MVIQLNTPLNNDLDNIKIYDKILISGKIFAARDSALQKLQNILLLQDKKNNLSINLQGSVIFHTAVSPAGIGPTSSNKYEIESSIPLLSQSGVKIHLGKGALSGETTRSLTENGSIFAITPPVSALLSSKIMSQKLVLFPEDGMEALFELTVDSLPALVAIANGKTLFKNTA